MFLQLSHSYSSNFLITQLEAAEQAILALTEPTLSEKTSGRVRFVFKHLSEPALLDALFLPNGSLAAQRAKLIQALEDSPL